MSSSTGSTPDTDSIDAPATTTAGTTSSNLALLYIIIAVLVGVLLYMAVRYGTSALHEWRERNGTGVGGHGALLGSDLGLSMDDITALPTFTYRSRAPMTPSSQTSRCGGGGKSKGRDQAAAVECVVCLQELVDGDVVRVLPACRHFFHGGCIDVWLRKRSSCPVCRAYPEPEAGARLGELSPPLPQLRRCGVSPERHPTSASRILADILARSPLRIGSSSAAKEEVILSRSASPMPTATAGDYVLSRSPPQAPLAHSASSETLEILVVRSKPPSPIRFGRQSTTRCVGVLERTDVIRSASASPATSRAQW